jgi:hypothetical protein
VLGHFKAGAREADTLTVRADAAPCADDEVVIGNGDYHTVVGVTWVREPGQRTQRHCSTAAPRGRTEAQHPKSPLDVRNVGLDRKTHNNERNREIRGRG